MEESWRRKVEGGEEVKYYSFERDTFYFFCLLAPLDSASDPLEGGEEVKCYCLEGDSFSFFCLLAPLDCASDPLEGGEEVKCYCLEGDSFSFLFSVSWHHSTLLQTHSASVLLKSCPVRFVFVYISSADTADADTASLLLHDVGGLRVRNSRHSTSS